MNGKRKSRYRVSFAGVPTLRKCDMKNLRQRFDRGEIIITIQTTQSLLAPYDLMAILPDDFEISREGKGRK